MQVHSCLNQIDAGAASFHSGMTIETDIKLIRDLIQWKDSNANQIAKAIGVANTTINRFANGTATTRLHRDTIRKLRERFPEFPGFEVQSDMLLPDTGKDYLPVEVLPSFAGMGGGGSGEGDTEHALIPRAMIEDELRAQPSDLLLIEARGESMAPDFLHGDQILIDKRDKNPVQPGSFALWDGDGYVVKLVERVPRERGRYRIFSVNDRFSAYEVEEDEIQIMGGQCGSGGDCSNRELGAFQYGVCTGHRRAEPNVSRLHAGQLSGWVKRRRSQRQ